MKNGDKVRSKDNRLVGRFVVVTEYTGYIDGDGWRTPECTIKDLLQYWKVIERADNIDALPFG